MNQLSFFKSFDRALELSSGKISNGLKNARRIAKNIEEMQKEYETQSDRIVSFLNRTTIEIFVGSESEITQKRLKSRQIIINTLSDVKEIKRKTETIKKEIYLYREVFAKHLKVIEGYLKSPSVMGSVGFSGITQAMLLKNNFTKIHSNLKSTEIIFFEMINLMNKDIESLTEYDMSLKSALIK